MPGLLLKHFQNAYITNDIDGALKTYRDEFGVAKFLEMEIDTKEKTHMGIMPMKARVALAWVGEHQIELIEPSVNPAGLYPELPLPAGAPRFHHIGVQVPDWDGLKAQLTERNHLVVLEGEIDGAKYLFTDQRQTLGHFIEYVYMPAEVEQRFNALIPQNA